MTYKNVWKRVVQEAAEVAESKRIYDEHTLDATKLFDFEPDIEGHWLIAKTVEFKAMTTSPATSITPLKVYYKSVGPFTEVRGVRACEIPFNCVYHEWDGSDFTVMDAGCTKCLGLRLTFWNMIGATAFARGNP